MNRIFAFPGLPSGMHYKGRDVHGKIDQLAFYLLANSVLRQMRPSRGGETRVTHLNYAKHSIRHVYLKKRPN